MGRTIFIARKEDESKRLPVQPVYFFTNLSGILM
jgi:hypothetical protein